MKKLTSELVNVVRAALSGARLAKFDASVEVINTSLAQGGWTPRGSVKASSGFYQGLVKYIHFDRSYNLSDKEDKAQDAASSLRSTLNFGSRMEHDVKLGIKTLRSSNDREGKPLKLKVSDEAILAWVALCNEVVKARAFLDDARPVPTITKIGLSPKVTMTLTECNLDLDLPSIRMADIDFKWVPAIKYDEKTKKFVPVFESDGKRKLVKHYFVKWTPGIAHNMSRFAGGGCHACGKHIPSGRFVPIEAKDKRSGKLISMWIGCDCSRNIFGIKDIGIEKDVKVGVDK